MKELAVKIKKVKNKTWIIFGVCAVLIMAVVVTAIVFTLKSGNLGKIAVAGEPQSREKVWSEVFDEEMEKTFHWFWTTANHDKKSPGYGLMPDDLLDKWNKSSTTGTGFALTIYPIGVEHGWVTKEEAYERTVGTLKTLLNNAEQEHGWYYHFVNTSDGKRFGDSEVSSIDQFLTISGVLFAGEYFGGEAKELASEIYERVEWDWFLDKEKNQYSLAYTPEDGFAEYYISAYAEDTGLFFLGCGSPTHPTDGSTYYAIDHSTSSYAGYPDFVMTPPYNQLFTYQFSHAWYDFRNKQDKNGTDYYYNSVIATLVSRQFCIDNQNIFETFNENSWGLTPSDGPYGYAVYGAAANSQIDGTIAPCGAAGSAPFAAKHVKNALEYYRGIDGLWHDEFGFYDAYNMDYGDGWYSQNMYNIDKGITIIMLENLRSGLVWKYMNQNKYVQTGMKKCGITNKQSYMLDDADGNQNIKGFTCEGGEIKITDAASKGEKAYEISVSDTASLKTEITIEEPEAAYMEQIRMDVQGECGVKVKLTDKDGKEIVTTDAETSDADQYKKLSFDLKKYADKITQAKNMEIIIEGGQNVCLDEIEFSTATDLIQYAVIDERPYVGKEIGVEYDFYSANGNEEPMYTFQWYSSDEADGHYDVIAGATNPTYKVKESDLGKILRVEVTPVDADGNQVGTACVSPESSMVTEEVPKSDKYTQRTLNDLKEAGAPDNTEGNTFDALNKWTDATNSVYDIQYNADETVMTVNFNKGGEEWPSMFRYIKAADISKYKSLTVKAKGTTAFNMLLESQSYETAEIRAYLSKDGTEFVWDLSGKKEQEILKSVSRIMIFAGPGSSTEKGKFEISKLQFSTNVAKGDNVVKTGGDNIAVNQYDSSSATFDVNKNWYSNDSGVYKITEGGAGSWNVSYEKPGKIEYAFMYSKVSGDVTDFKKIVFEVQGQKGKELTFSAYGDKANPTKDEPTWQNEVQNYVLSGGRDVVEVDLRHIDKADLAKINKIMIFADPGKTTDSTGSFKLFKAYFSKEEYIGNGPNLPGDTNTYRGEAGNFSINKNWCATNPETIKVTGSSSKTVVSWSKKEKFDGIACNVKGNFSNFKYLVLKVKGTAEKNLFVKFYGVDNDVARFVTNGKEQYLVADIRKDAWGNALKNADSVLNGLQAVYLFPGAEDVSSGSIEISEAYFSNTDPTANKYSGKGKTFSFNKNWSPTATTMKVQSEKGKTTVNWSSKNKFDGVETKAQGNFSDFNYIVFEVKGTKNQNLYLKFDSCKNDIARFVANGKKQVLAVKIKTDAWGKKVSDEKLDQITKIYLYPGAETKNAGKIEITKAYFSKTDPTAYRGNGNKYSFNKNWKVSNAKNMKLSKKNSVYQAKWKKKDKYDSMETSVSGKFSGFNYIVLKVKGTAGQNLFVKFDSSKNDSARFVMNGKQQFLVTKLKTDAWDKPVSDKIIHQMSKIYLFPGAETKKAGSIEVYEAYFSKTDPTEHVYRGKGQNAFDINRYWEPTNASVRVREDGAVTAVNWSKKGKYDGIASKVDGDFSDFEYLVLKVKGTAGQKLFVKFEGMKSDTERVVLTGKEQWIITKIKTDAWGAKVNVSDLDRISKVYLFPGAEAKKAGKLQVYEAYFSKTDPQENRYGGDGDNFSFNQKWTADNTKINISENGKGTVIGWSAKGKFDGIVSKVKGRFSDFDYIVLKVKGTKGQNLYIKFDSVSNDVQRFQLNGKEQTLLVDIRKDEWNNRITDRQLDAIEKIFIFPGAEKQSSGRLEIYSAYFTK